MQGGRAFKVWCPGWLERVLGSTRPVLSLGVDLENEETRGFRFVAGVAQISSPWALFGSLGY